MCVGKVISILYWKRRRTSCGYLSPVQPWRGKLKFTPVLSKKSDFCIQTMEPAIGMRPAGITFTKMTIF